MELSINLKVNEYEKLKELAKDSKQKESSFAHDIISNYLEIEDNIDEGDIKAAKIAKKRYADIVAGKSKTIPWEEMKKKYDL